MAHHSTVLVSIDTLRVGATCSHPVATDGGILLLGAKSLITEQVISRLRDRGIDSIAMHPGDLAALQGRKKRKVAADKRERDNSASGKWMPSKPVKELLVDRHDEDLSEERTQLLKRGMGDAKAQFDQLQAMMTDGQWQSIGDLTTVSDTYAKAMVDDHDQTVGVMGTLTTVSDLAERSVRMSVIGMAIGVELGLDGPQILEIGMAGLLHDIGMFGLDSKYAQSTNRLTASERWEYQKHPLRSVEYLKEVMDIPHSVQLAVQQVHEQYDGSGYPRGVKGQRIHLYARILNVVDTYLQLTASTEDRRAIVPHDALGVMLHQAGSGIFDPQVIRAFLNTESMYPLGSLVELDNGELAQVIRRPKSGFAAPVLKDSDGNRIEMESTSLRIARPALDPHLDQMRLTNQMMQEARWCPISNMFLV